MRAERRLRTAAGVFHSSGARPLSVSSTACSRPEPSTPMRAASSVCKAVGSSSVGGGSSVSPSAGTGGGSPLHTRRHSESISNATNVSMTTPSLASAAASAAERGKFWSR